MATFDKNIFSSRGYFSNAMAQYRNRADLQSYLEIILSLLTITLFAAFALRPTLITIATLLQEIQAKKDTLAQIETKLQILSDAQRNFERERTAITLLETSFRQGLNSDAFIRQIEGLAQKNDVTVQSITIDKGELFHQAIVEYPQQIKINPSIPEIVEKTPFFIIASVPKNDYQKIESFIKDLNSSRFAFEIEGLNIASQKTQSEELIVMTANGKILYMKDSVQEATEEMAP